jgi:hypothetical protein
MADDSNDALTQFALLKAAQAANQTPPSVQQVIADNPQAGAAAANQLPPPTGGNPVFPGQNTSNLNRPGVPGVLQLIGGLKNPPMMPATNGQMARPVSRAVIFENFLTNFIGALGAGLSQSGQRGAEGKGFGAAINYPIQHQAQLQALQAQQARTEQEQALTQRYAAGTEQTQAATDTERLNQQILLRRLGMMQGLGDAGTGNILSSLGQLSGDEKAVITAAQQESAIKGDITPLVSAVQHITQTRALTGRFYDQPAKNFQNTIAKIAPELPAGAISDVNKLSAAISKSARLTPGEKSDALGYIAAHPTPASQASNTRIRIEGMGAIREYPVLNTQTNSLEMRSAADINAANKLKPGTYAPAGEGAKAMSKQAIFSDLHYNIQNARDAINGLESMDAATRGKLSVMLRQTDPKSAVSTFLTSSAGQTLTDAQQNAAIALASLQENAMTLRSVAGMGQGSDELRSAILATIPSGKTPSKGYALKQLAQFEGVVSRLETGVPRLGGGGNTGKTSVIDDLVGDYGRRR